MVYVVWYDRTSSAMPPAFILSVTSGFWKMDATSLHLVCGFWFLKDGTGCAVLFVMII
jgi:hypothetical protein